jgi:hypothetical protein
MNLNYTSSLQNAPPSASVNPAGIKAVPPFAQYGSTYTDLMRAYGDRNAAQYALDASKADTQYELQRQKATQDLALQGLQQMSQAQQNQQSLGNQQLGTQTSFLSSLLSGVFS